MSASADLRSRLRPPSAKVAAELAKRHSAEALAQRMQHNVSGVLSAPSAGQQITLNADHYRAALALSRRQGLLERLDDSARQALEQLPAPVTATVVAWPQMTATHADGSTELVMGLRGAVRLAVQVDERTVHIDARPRNLGLPLLPRPAHLGPVFRQPRKPTWA